MGDGEDLATLIEEFGARAQRAGAAPLIGRCDPQPTANYQPVVEILRTLLEPLDTQSRSTLPAPLALLLPDIIEPKPDADGESGVDGAQFRLFEAVATTIAKIRSRWKEAAAGDLLEAQLALDQKNLAAAAAFFDAALKKDPNNKLVQFWKAQLDSRTGSASEAARTFEAIARERPVKEVDSGLSLMSAAQSALANLALENGDIDAAIGVGD